MNPTRPVMRYHGGKWRLAPWVISNLPSHQVYVEPYGGAGSVLMRKPRSFAEIYNDLDGEVVNVFRVLRSRIMAAELRRLLRLTPFSRDEFWEAYQVPDQDDYVERARRTLIRSFMGFGSTTRAERRTGFRAASHRNRSKTGQHDWARYPAAIETFTERLQGVLIENRPALEVIEQQAGPDTLYYVDPPYPISTRSSIRCDGDLKRTYHTEMTDDDHRVLAEVLHATDGMVVLSGYHSPLYDELYGAWASRETEALADGARRRTEVLWFNPAAISRQAQTEMFR